MNKPLAWTRAEDAQIVQFSEDRLDISHWPALTRGRTKMELMLRRKRLIENGTIDPPSEI